MDYVIVFNNTIYRKMLLYLYVCFSYLMKMRRNIIIIIQLTAYWPLLLLFKIFFNFKVRGIGNLKKAGDSFIIAVNHVSYLDPISVPLAMPFRFKYFPLFYMGISYVAAKSNRLILPLKIESNLDGAVSVLGGKVIDLLTRKYRIKMIFGKPFRIEETIGKTPESLSELRKASENVFRRIDDIK